MATGLNDIITVPSYGPAEVKVFRNVLAGGVPTFDVQNPYRDFLAFPSSFIGGAVVAAADMGSTPLTTGPFDNTQRDQKAEIVIGSGAGIKTTVKVFDVSRMTVPTPTAMPAAAQSFTPYSTTTTNYKGGVSLSVARINADLIPDIVVGASILSVSPLQVAPPVVIPGSYLGPYVIATIRNPLPTAMMPQPLIASSPVVSAPALSPVSNTARTRFSWSTISNAATYEIWGGQPFDRTKSGHPRNRPRNSRVYAFVRSSPGKISGLGPRFYSGGSGLQTSPLLESLPSRPPKAH